jgi:uncharacterized protein with PQ loop repeat
MAMTLCFMVCYIPQILKLIKTKSSKDVSFLMIFLSFIGYIFGMLYMFINGFALWFFINYFSGLISSSILIYLWFKYRD